MAANMHIVRAEGECANALLCVGVLFDRPGGGYHGIWWRRYRFRGNCQDSVLFVPGSVPGEPGDACRQTSLTGRQGRPWFIRFDSYNAEPKIAPSAPPFFFCFR